jgi:hypothetical protein
VLKLVHVASQLLVAIIIITVGIGCNVDISVVFVRSTVVKSIVEFVGRRSLLFFSFLMGVIIASGRSSKYLITCSSSC